MLTSNPELFNQINTYIENELARMITLINDVLTLRKKTMYTKESVETSLNVSYNQLSEVNVPSRMFSTKKINSAIHKTKFKVKSSEPVIALLKIMLYRRLKFLIEKAAYVA